MRPSSSRSTAVSVAALFVFVLLALSFINVCVAQYYSSSGDYGSSGGEGSSGDYGSSSDSPFSSAGYSSSGEGSSAGSSGGASSGGSSGGSSAGSSGGSSVASSVASSVGSSAATGASSSGLRGSSSAARHTSAAAHTSAPKSNPTSAPKTNPTSAPKANPTSAPKANPTSAPKANPTSAAPPVQSSTGGIGCTTGTQASLPLSANGVQFIQSGEAFAPFYYLDTATPPKATIGFGHNCAAKNDCTTAQYTKGYLTLAEATTVLNTDTATATTSMRSVIPAAAQLTQNQFNVLVDMAFNFGSVPSSMVTFVKSQNNQPIPLQTFSNAVKQVTGSNPTRVQQEASYSLQCGNPTFTYPTGDGQYCTATGVTGLCLDSSIYSCPSGSFVAGTSGCHPDAASIQCCSVVTPTSQTNTVLLNISLATQPQGVPKLTNIAVNPATFNTNIRQ